jgi:hypothetical protein
MPRIQQIVRLRPEVVEGNLHGIISLYALLEEDSSAFEGDAQRVFSATYPSTALVRLLRRLQTSLSMRDADRKGNFVISGGYGSGKSHLLLSLYHILASPSRAHPWLAEHQIDFSPPQDAIVVLMPMTNLTQPSSDEPVEYLWTPIFDALSYDGFRHTGSNFPMDVHLRKAVAGRRVFLVIDEIERWFMPIRDRHQAEANLSFLQNLTEFARNPENGMYVFLTLLMLEPRIGNIVGRDDAFFEDLTQAPDRRQVVLYRLVESVNETAARQVVDAYLDRYRPVDAHVRIGDYSRYRQQLLECYPFHPETIEVVFERYSSVARKEETSYQNSRGALYLLAHVLQETLPPGQGGTGQLHDHDLLLPGDISLTIERLTDDLINLDPRLVEIARENVARSVEQGVPNSAPVLSTVLLHSLGDPRAERRLGAGFGEVLLGTLRPGDGPGEGITASGVQMILQQLEETALNLHVEPHPPRWVFRAEVNVVAQINRRARRDEYHELAQKLIVQTLKKLVGGAVCVFPFDDISDQRELTLVLTTQRLESEEILDQLYYGRAYPNALLIVDPQDMASVTDDPDLLWIARRIQAAEDLRFDLVGDPDAQQRVTDFLEGVSGVRQALTDRLRDRYGAWRAPIYDPERGDLTFTRVQVPLSRAAIFRLVEERYDAGRFRQNVMEAVEGRTTPPTVADVRAEFLRQRSFAKPVRDGRPSDAPVDQAIRDLVIEARLEVVKGGDERYICGRDPGHLQLHWTVAVPPEAHKPRFRLDDSVRAVVEQHPEGLTVQQVRQHCRQDAAQFPDEVVDAGRVDAQLADLLAHRELETPGVDLFPQGPLPDDLVVRPARGEPDAEHGEPRGPESLSFGPGPVPQLKTDMIRRLDKTDRLTQVTISYRCTLHAGDLVSHRDLVGIEGEDPGDAVLTLDWTLRQAPITDRDSAVALLNRLPHPLISEVTVHMRREKAG